MHEREHGCHGLVAGNVEIPESRPGGGTPTFACAADACWHGHTHLTYRTVLFLDKVFQKREELTIKIYPVHYVPGRFETSRIQDTPASLTKRARRTGHRGDISPGLDLPAWTPKRHVGPASLECARAARVIDGRDGLESM